MNSSSNDGWKLLLENTAPNALHDSRQRFDPPKCDEDTRVEVIDEIVNWIQDRDSPQRLLCMTGAAGAGKSALQQTIAETCESNDTLGSAYFFSASDSTRNTITTVIPTIAYQLGLKNPVLKSMINSAIEEDPLIFSKSLQVQTMALIVKPVGRICGRTDASALPHAILIDGLDECRNEGQQTELLTVIKTCFLNNSNLPFRIFLASRPELAIRTELEPGGCLHEKVYHIHLNDQYDATDDISRYLWRRLRDIGRRSRDPRARSAEWPDSLIVERIVTAASGQFIFAATVIKYISEPRGSPVDRLETVVTWTDWLTSKTKSFEVLDVIYAQVLSTAKSAYEAVDTNEKHDFLLLLNAHAANVYGPDTVSVDVFDRVLGLGNKTHELLISDLHSLVTTKVTKPGEGENSQTKLHFYHKSFLDFMDAEERAKDLYVNPERVHAHVAACCVKHIRDYSSRFVPPSTDSGYLSKENADDHEFILIAYKKLKRALEGLARTNLEATKQLLMELTRGRGWEKFDHWILHQLRSRKDNKWGLAFGVSEEFEPFSRLLDQLEDNFETGQDPEFDSLFLNMKTYVDKWVDEMRDLVV
ncbi:hypothetical protein H1R20_g10694, partial [Candolleomyces eurysporus]